MIASLEFVLLASALAESDSLVFAVLGELKTQKVSSTGLIDWPLYCACNCRVTVLAGIAIFVPSALLLPLEDDELGESEKLAGATDDFHFASDSSSESRAEIRS